MIVKKAYITNKKYQARSS